MLYLIIAVLLALLAVLLIRLIGYRRQVRDICRQLSFLKEEHSNLVIMTSMQSKDVESLAGAINRVIEEWRVNSNELMKNREVLQNTVMSLSHDIRTPLTSLKGYFQLLEECGNEEERKRYSAIIEGRIRSLNTILEELFTYTKLQDAGYMPEPEKTDMSKLLTDTLLGFYEEFKAAGIEPEADIAERVNVFVNEEALLRILQNLIKNALTHSVSRVRIKLEADGRQARLSVSNDTAKPEEIELERIFDRFYKADADRSKGSTGLGLSIVRGLCGKTGCDVKAALAGDIFSVTVKLPQR